MQQHSHLFPTMNDKSRFIVLIDATPNVGPLNGFFSVELKRRTINGFTTNSALYVLNFLRKLAHNVHEAGGETIHSLPMRSRYQVCVLNRFGGGSVLDWRSFEYLATEALLERVTARLQPGTAIQDRYTQFTSTRDRAIRIINSLPVQARPQLTLIDGQRPGAVLARAGRWQLQMPETDLPYSLEANLPELQGVRDYMADPAVSAPAKREAWRAFEIVSTAYDAIRPKMLDEALVRLSHKQTSGKTVDPVQRLGHTAGFRPLADRALRRAESEQGYKPAALSESLTGMPPEASVSPTISTYSRPKDALMGMLIRAIFSKRIDLSNEDAVKQAITDIIVGGYLTESQIFGELHKNEPPKVAPRESNEHRSYLVKLSRSVGPVAANPELKPCAPGLTTIPGSLPAPATAVPSITIPACAVNVIGVPSKTSSTPSS